MSTHTAKHAVKPPLDSPMVKPPAGKLRTIAKWSGISLGGFMAIGVISSALSPEPASYSHTAPTVTHSAPAVQAPRKAPPVTVPASRKAPSAHKVQPVSHKTAPAPHKAPPATPARAISAAPSICPALATWANNGGTAESATVQADLTQVQNDALAQNMPALVGDGEQLSTDASTALNDPPPVESMAGPYKAAMSDLIHAGNLLGIGDVMTLPAATSYVQRAAPEMVASTSALEATGCSNL
jgi:hypothetical protein